MNDLVIVHPMTSYSGSVAYLKYVALSDKPAGYKGAEFNSVFGLGEMTDNRVNYTSQIIIDVVTDGALTPSFAEVVTGGLTYEEGGAIKAATYKVIKTDGTYEYAEGIPTDLTGVAKVAYVAKQFQMTTVPAEDIPTVGPKMEHIALVAEPRRIAVKYDQITA